MPSHELPLVRIERARLVEDLRRDDELADVVQQQSEAELHELLVDLVEAALPAMVDPTDLVEQPPRDEKADGRDVDAVLQGVRVSDGEILQCDHGVAAGRDLLRDQLRDLAELADRLGGMDGDCSVRTLSIAVPSAALARARVCSESAWGTSMPAPISSSTYTA